MESKLILLVDDEDAFLEIASLRLEAAGFKTAHAHSVAEGLARVHELMPDAIISDVFMPPGPNGWRLALEVKGSRRTSHIPFAFLTSLNDPWPEHAGDREAVKARVGEVAIFNKVQDLDDLGEKIAKFLNRYA